MTTPPDKCPKCGAKTQAFHFHGNVYSCGSKSYLDIATPRIIQTDLCLMTQRAKRAEKDLGKPTDEPNPNGSTHARLNWWKDQCDKSIERAEKWKALALDFDNYSPSDDWSDEACALHNRLVALIKEEQK